MNKDLEKLKEEYIKEFDTGDIENPLQLEADWWLDKISQRDQALRERIKAYGATSEEITLKGTEYIVSLLEPANTSGE